jgi:hypothetical protein
MSIAGSDPSFDSDPNTKGSYRRRIEDIALALAEINAEKLSPAANFVALFFGCEKLAQAVVGIAGKVPADQQYLPKNKIKLPKVLAARDRLGLTVSHHDVRELFSTEAECAGGRLSARVLRNNLVHDFGPTRAKKVAAASARLTPAMKRFLAEVPHVVAYLVANDRKRKK